MHLNAGVPEDYISHLPAYLLKNASFDMMQLARIKDYNQLLGALHGTPYYDVLVNIPSVAGQVDFNRCENALRSFYTDRIVSLVHQEFEGTEKSALLDLINAQTDLINVINIYRMIHYFKMSPENIKKHVLPIKGRLSERVKQSMIEAPDSDAFRKILSTTSYGSQLISKDERFRTILFEQKISQLRIDMTKRALMFSRSAAVSLYAILYILEVEIKNIITIVEGVRYGKTPNYLEELLVII
jgi:V/A-type H+-transporting ATPase subunit C